MARLAQLAGRLLRRVRNLLPLPLTEFRLWLQSDAAAYYTFVGDDVIDYNNEGFADPAKPLWLNLGYWKDATTYPAACAALATRLGDLAGLSPADPVLDVGFGFAEQDFFWLEKYGVQHITGVNITPAQVELAQRRVRDRKLQDRIELILGSATALPLPSESFEKVMALECAFHFNTRERFFDEAYRVLRPDGRLAVADMLPLPGRDHSGLLRRYVRRSRAIPEANMYDINVYMEKLRARGFVNVQAVSIRQFVYPGARKYITLRSLGQTMASAVVNLTEKDMNSRNVSEPWHSYCGMGDYVLVTADKPGISR